MFWLDRTDASDDLPFLIDGENSLSYEQTFSRSDDVFQPFERSVVAILCGRNIETVIGYVGALRHGPVPFMLDANLDEDALSRLLDSYKAELIFCPFTIRLAGYEPVVQSGAYTLMKRSDINDYREMHPDLGLLLPTSGTTGDPKSVRLSQKNIQSCTESIVRYLELESNRRAISLLPLQYSYGLSVLNSIIEARGSYYVSSHSPISREFWDGIVTSGITDLSAVPFIFESIKRMRFSGDILKTLKYVTQAGGRLDPKLTAHFHSIFSEHGIKYFTMYGQTEASPRICYLDPVNAKAKAGSVGRVIDIGKVSIRHHADSSDAGELVYTGPNVCMGYAVDRQDLLKADDFGGILMTGDLAKIDADGFVYITGRIKRNVKLHGMSVNLDFIESRLRESGLDARIIGRDNLVTAIVVGGDVEEALSFMRDNFAFHNSVLRAVSLDIMPLNVSGKPDYKELEREHLGA